MDFTQNQEIWQWIDQHWDEFCDYWASKMKEASSVEQIAYDQERISGLLANFNWQGVSKVVKVTPESLLQALSQLNEELRQRCIDGADQAEQAASYANSQGDYAKSQGDRIDALIQEITELKARVKTQGDMAELQGNAAEAQMNEVKSWYTPFKTAAESWYSGTVADVTAWFAETKNDWNTWFAARKTEWTDWFSGVTSDWSTWYNATKEDWNTWFAARKLEWTNWFNGVVSDWNTCYDTWNTWFSAARELVTAWATKEEERQSAEEIRQEMMAHPPIPSERGYWMYWDVTTHEYVESGYSSRGTLDWPDFFWDYSCMGLGVNTTRDFTNFSIDELGRFKLKM